MPYVLEEMIYKAYKNAGWNLETGENKYFEIARNYLSLEKNSELRNLFLPTLSELANLVDDAIKDFFPDKSDYGISLVGALKSRLNSLSRGAKGLLLNQKLSLPLQFMLDRPCVIELESFADNDEKAFIMALLLSRIYEFRAGKLSKDLKHVLVIEEAHRLLSKPYQAGEYTANSRAKSVEVFSDMLAEIRAYGQGIVIADQIPAKLIPDVIKNTDIKIVHRLMAKEDREAVGTAMNLTAEQINDLNRSTPGLATVSFDGLNSAIRVQIRNVPLRSDDAPIETVHLDVMSEYKQKLFLSEAHDTCMSAGDKKDQALWLVLRLFFIAAICKKSDALITFRSRLLEKNASNQYISTFNEKELWPCVAEGAHAFISYLGGRWLPSEIVSIVASALVAFARPWSQKQIFHYQLRSFVNLVKQNVDFNSRDSIAKKDYLAVMLQCYVDETDFHQTLPVALLNGNASDWVELKKLLAIYANDLTFNLIPHTDSDTLNRLFLRLLTSLQSNDQQVHAKAGTAYASIIQLLPENDNVLSTQKWRDC
jgi:hypothetical protein